MANAKDERTPANGNSTAAERAAVIRAANKAVNNETGKTPRRTH
jgi:hypothetical protein